MMPAHRDPRTLHEVRQELRRIFAGAGQPPENETEVLLCAGLHSAFLVTFENSEDTAFSPGDTKFGGWPDALPEWVWPTDLQGTPLRFLCQLSLPDVDPAGTSDWLPDQGLLSVFWNFSSSAAHLTYVRDEDLSRLQRRSPADPQNEQVSTYLPRRMHLRQCYRLVSEYTELTLTDFSVLHALYPACKLAVEGTDPPAEGSDLTLFGVSEFPFGFPGSSGRPVHDPQLPVVSLWCVNFMDDDIADDVDGNHNYNCDILVSKQRVKQGDFSSAWLDIDAQ
ncbi:DUF1963 domain-containing protein [Deinococcus oregonensis]|uniref:DUF1963 domain-containing protein n=1 Tax=Deinococcus oregonensis TaxID=1805970 RepID=A0ABV6B2D4_9DEIO